MSKYRKEEYTKTISFFSRQRRPLIILLLDILLIIGIFAYISHNKINVVKKNIGNLQFMFKYLNLKKTDGVLLVFQINNLSDKEILISDSFCNFQILTNNKVVFEKKKELSPIIKKSKEMFIPSDEISFCEVLWLNKMNKRKCTFIVIYKFNGEEIKLKL